MTANSILYGLTDEGQPYEGWEGANGWINSYFKNDLQNKSQWIFLYTQNLDVEDSIFLSYRGQIRAELEIEGWVSNENDLVKNYREELGKNGSERGPRIRGYKVKTIRIFEDNEELKLGNLGISRISFGKNITDKVDEIRNIVGNSYEEIVRKYYKFKLTAEQEDIIKNHYYQFKNNLDPNWDDNLNETKKKFDSLIQAKKRESTFNFEQTDVSDLLDYIQVLSNLDWAPGWIFKALNSNKLKLGDLNQKLFDLYTVEDFGINYYKNLLHLKRLHRIGNVTASQIACYFNNENFPLYTKQQWSVITKIFDVADWREDFSIQEDPEFFNQLPKDEKEFIYKIYILKHLKQFIEIIDGESFDFFKLNKFLWTIYEENKKKIKQETEIAKEEKEKVDVEYEDLVEEILIKWKEVIMNFSLIDEKERRHFNLEEENLRVKRINNKINKFISESKANEDEFRDFWDELYSARQSGRATSIIKKNTDERGDFDVQQVKETLKSMKESDEYLNEWQDDDHIKGAEKTLWELFGVIQANVPMINNCSINALELLKNIKLRGGFNKIKNKIDEFKEFYLEKIGHITDLPSAPSEIKSTVYHEIDKLFNVIDKLKMEDYENATNEKVKELYELVLTLKGSYMTKPSTTFDEDMFGVELSLENLIFDQPEKLIKRITNALKNDNHIILIGPPGTGKSKVAKVICDTFRGEDGYDICTATSDWSTFETIGGYKLDEKGNLEFNPGLFLKCFISKENLKNNRWLIIDELNRADIDKAFGVLFTTLAGDNVTIPFTKENRPIKIMADYKNVTFSSDSTDNYCYYIPENWRIIATMNTYDKSSLYQMSYAFMRRFAFIMIDIPIIENINGAKISEYIRCWEENTTPDPDLCKNIADLWIGIIKSKRKIGPAIIRDIYNYIKGTALPDFVGAITMFILPQFEGLLEKDIIDAIKNIKKLSFIDDEAKDELDDYASEFFLINKKSFELKKKSSDKSEAEEPSD